MLRVRQWQHHGMPTRTVYLAVLLLVGTVAFAFGFGVGRYDWPPSAHVTAFLHLIRGSQPADSETAPQLNPHYLARTSLFELSAGMADVVMLGDSLTEAADWSELLLGVNVVNRGIAGDTSHGVRQRLSEVVSRQPKLVFLLIGTNDIGSGLTPGFTTGNVEAIILEILRSSKAKLVVQAVPFAGRPHDGLITRRAVRTLNVALSQLSARHSLEFLDINGAIAPTELLGSDYTSDGIHFTGLAYKAWVEMIRPIIDRCLSSDGSCR